MCVCVCVCASLEPDLLACLLGLIYKLLFSFLYVQMVAALLKGGAEASPHASDSTLWTPLHIAALSGYPACVQMLLQVLAASSLLLLHFICIYGFALRFNLLTSAGYGVQGKADTTAKCARGETALQWATANKEHECVKLLA